MTILLWLAITLGLSPTPETFYVCQGGTGTAPQAGVCATAWDLAALDTDANWAAVAAADGKVGPGDTVVFLADGGTLRHPQDRSLKVRASGLPGLPITLRAADGQQPVIANNRLRADWVPIADSPAYRSPTVWWTPLFLVVYTDAAGASRLLAPHDGALASVALNEWDWDEASTLYINVGDDPRLGAVEVGYADYGLSLNGHSHLTLDGLTFRANRMNGIFAWGADLTGLVFRNVRCEFNGYIGLQVERAPGVVVEGGSFSHNGNDGIYLANGCTDCRIAAAAANDNGAHAVPVGDHDGIGIGGSKGGNHRCYLAGVRAERNGGAGVAVYLSNDVTITEATLAQNLAANVGASAVSRLFVLHSTLYGSARGVSVGGASHDPIAAYNEIRGATVAGVQVAASVDAGAAVLAYNTVEVGAGGWAYALDPLMAPGQSDYNTFIVPTLAAPLMRVRGVPYTAGAWDAYRTATGQDTFSQIQIGG